MLEKPYDVTIGLNYFSSATATAVKLFEQQTEIFILNPVFQEEVKEEAPLAKQTLPIAKIGDTDIMTAAAQQSLSIEMKVSREVAKDDEILFTFELDMEAGAFADGSIITQWAELSDPYNPDETTGVSCNIQKAAAGDVYTVQSFNQKGIDNTAAATGAISTVNTAGKDTAGTETYTKSDKPDAFKLDSSKITGNKVQKCTAVIKLPKMSRDQSFFDTFTVKTGSRIYTSDADAAPKSLAESTFDFALPEPTYDDFSTAAVTAADMTTQKLKEEFFFIEDTTALGGKAGEFGEMRMDSEFKISTYFDQDDIFKLILTTDLPSAILPNGSIVYQYAQMLPSSGTAGTTPMTSVGCKTVVGDPSLTAVENFEGLKKLSGATDSVKGKSW